jgi:hypothetical protein
MPSSEQANWQPISQLPLTAGMIDGAVDDTAEHMLDARRGARTAARSRRCHRRIERIHGEQLEFVEICAEQLRRWKAERSGTAQLRELERLFEQNNRLRQLTADVLALAHELRRGTIERIMAMSDLELGLQALLRTPPSDPP